MGNAQSAGHDHEHHHHRLSKPKTNTNSPSLPAKNDSPVSISSRYANLSFRERQQIKTHLLSPIDTDFGRPDSSDADDELGELAATLQRRLSTLSTSNSLSCFGSKDSPTAKFGSLPGSKVSLVSNGQVVDLDTAMEILQEVRKNASREDLAALHQALQSSGTCPSPRPSPVPEQGVTRRTSINRSSSSLIRRRSLLATPGVATRNSPIERNRRTWNSWRTPQLESSEGAKWRVDMMGTSPLTRLTALDLAEQGRDSPTPRARTPGDMEYSHLGSLKLGSLVVTNGAPSPAPSAKVSRLLNSNPAPEEDYFTASERCDSPIMMKPTKRRWHKRSKSAVQPMTPPLYRNLRVPDQPRRAKTASRCDSPLKAEAQNVLLDDEPEPEPMRRLRVMNKSADTLAKAYQAEISNSPFDSSFNPHAGDLDEGFVSDDARSFREQAFRILDGTIFSEPATTLEPARLELKPSPVVETFKEKTKKKKRASNRPPPKKADSGYSSGGSFRTAQHEEALKEGTVPTLSKKPSRVADLVQSGNGADSDNASLYTFEEMLRLPISKPLPPVPTGDKVAPRPPSLQIPQTTEYSASTSTTPDLVNRVLEVASLSNASPKTPVSVVSKFSIDSRASAQKRLQKRRPSYQELPVVQSCEPVVGGTIPDIPANVRTQFVRRLSSTPGMECLTRTYPSKDHVTANESVVDSPVTVNIEFPSPSTSPEPRGRHHRRSATERPPTPPPHGFRRSLSLFRSKSTAEKEKEKNREEDDAASYVVDFGTTATSLGRSPYDAAMAKVPTKAVTSPTHPYQLGNILPRTKSMVNMDARTAAELARTRSKDRAMLRPEMPQRSRSYHDMNIDAGEGAAYTRRPHSFNLEAPTMPSAEPNRHIELHDELAHQTPIEASQGPLFRARQSGRGPVVSQLINKYDHYGQRLPEQHPQDQNWEAHARLWSQRRKSIGEGLRQRAEEDARSTRATTEPPKDVVVIDRYSGGLDYGYEGRGYGVGGSAGTRQLHSYASRKSMHFSNQFGVDLSDVPLFVQRV